MFQCKEEHIEKLQVCMCICIHMCVYMKEKNNNQLNYPFYKTKSLR